MQPDPMQIYRKVLGINAPVVDDVNDNIKMRVYEKGMLGYIEKDVGIVSLTQEKRGRDGKVFQILVQGSRISALAEDAFYGMGMLRALNIDHLDHLEQVVQREGVKFETINIGQGGVKIIYSIYEAPSRIFLNQDDMYAYAGYLMLGNDFYAFTLYQIKMNNDPIILLGQLGRRYFHI